MKSKDKCILIKSNCAHTLSPDSIDKLADDIDAHAHIDVVFSLKVFQSSHYLLVCCTEHFFDFVDAEGAPWRVVCTVLEVPDIDQLICLSLLGRQVEESSAV